MGSSPIYYLTLFLLCSYNVLSEYPLSSAFGVVALYLLHHELASERIVLHITSRKEALAVFYDIHAVLNIHKVAGVYGRVLKELLDHLVLGLEVLDNHLALAGYELKAVLPAQVGDEALALQIAQLYIAHHLIPTIELFPLVYNLVLE